MQALKKLVGVAVAAELATLGGSYYAFHKLNTDPEFRGWWTPTAPRRSTRSAPLSRLWGTTFRPI